MSSGKKIMLVLSGEYNENYIELVKRKRDQYFANVSTALLCMHSS